jgi:DNA-binding MarR family transcriptional regulator
MMITWNEVLMGESAAALRRRVGLESQAYRTAVDDFDAAVAARLRVNRTDLRCLEILRAEGAVAPKRLGARLGLTTGSVTAMLDRMERAGHLTRSPDPRDRRRLLVRITQQTERTVGELYGPLLAEGDEVTGRYSEDELRLVAGFLGAARGLYERHLNRVRAG